MEGTEEVPVGAFVWKIYEFSELEDKTSSKFKFGKYDCFLYIYEVHRNTTRHSFMVYLIHSKGKSIRYKTFCKLCVIDGLDAEFLVTKFTILNFEKYVHLMTILHSDLFCKENDLLPEDVLTLRLSWCDEDGGNRKQSTQTTLDLNSEEKPSKMLHTLSKDLGRFYESKVDTDFLLRVGEDQIPVHRAVLSARSEVFAAMFRHDTSENRSGVVDILDVDVAALSDVLYYVYSGQARGMSADTVCPMYVVADKYALIELRDACLVFLMRSLTVENICDAALLAHTHGETQLEEKVVQFVKEKLEEIEETDKWKEFLKSKPSLAFKLIRSTLMIYKDEVKSLSSK